MRNDPNLGSYGQEQDDESPPPPPVTETDYHNMLCRLVAMWKQVRDDEPLPDCLNDPDVWDEAAALIRRAEGVPDIFDDL